MKDVVLRNEGVPVQANGYYEELQVAKSWGILPSAWRALSRTDREEMIAEYKATGKKDAAIFELSKPKI